MTDTPETLAARLEKEGERTAAFFQELSASDWDAAVYSEGAAWPVREIISHIVEAEHDLPRLFKRIVDAGEGVPDDFDLDRYNESKVNKAGERSPQEITALFVKRRTETVAIITSFTEGDLQKTGKHPYLGEAEVVEMVKLMYLHVKLHMRDIRRALKE